MSRDGYDMFGMLTIFKWSDVRHQILNRSVESPMENFLGNGAAQASASSSSVGDLMGTTLLRAPNEASEGAHPSIYVAGRQEGCQQYLRVQILQEAN